MLCELRRLNLQGRLQLSLFCVHVIEPWRTDYKMQFLSQQEIWEIDTNAFVAALSSSDQQNLSCGNLKITLYMIKGVKLCGLKLWVDYSTVTQFKPPLHGADRSCNYNYTLWSKQPLFYQLLKCDVRSAFLCERCSNIQLRCRRVDVFQIKV